MKRIEKMAKLSQLKKSCVFMGFRGFFCFGCLLDDNAKASIFPPATESRRQSL